ncbi:MAG: tetratricopeptide repeat protein [Bacteroidales bacterium]|nr:tetratricopeptide repeat protein [Bacteroidales bacterium]
MISIIKYIFLFGLIFILNIPTNAQDSTVDSIKSKLLQLKGIERVPSLLQIAEELDNTDLSLSIKYTNEALLISETIGDQEKMALCNKQLGVYFYQQAKYSKAQYYFKKALSIYSIEGEDGEVSEAFLNIGLLFSREGILDSASFYYQLAWNIAQKSLDTLRQVSSLRSIGNILYKKGQFDESLRTFHQALSLASHTNNCYQEKGMLYNNLGILFSDWGKYKESLAYYQQALSIMDSLNIEEEISRIFNNMGTIYWYVEKPDSALYFYSKSLKIRKEIGDINGIAFVLNNLGMYYGSLEQYDKSMNYFKQSLWHFENLQNRMGVVMSLYNIGSVYQELKQYDLAKKHFNQSLHIAKAQGFFDYIVSNYEALKDIYFVTNEWEKAYYSLYHYKSLKDSLRKVQNISLLSDIEVKFGKEKKRADLQILQNKMQATRINKNQTLIIIFGVLVILVLIIISTYLLIRQITSKSELEHSKLTPALLRYQLNPQFINSNLSGIKELISKNRVEESSVFLAGFAKLIRTFIETSSSSVIVLDKEIETTKSFLKLHQLRYDHQLSYELNIASHVETEMLAVPPFVFFPVLVHVIDNYLNEGKIDAAINIDTQENYLINQIAIKYSINPNNFESDEMAISRSITNVQERITLLNKSLKEKMVFTHNDVLNKDSQIKILKLKLKMPIKPM